MSRLQTGFLPGPGGSLHVSLFLPEAVETPSAWVVHVPAFAEEMNKSRAMVARQARSLVSQGLAVLVPDLLGTGDSAGRLQEATWQGWRDDITCVVAWAREQGAAHLTLWGNRMGCLLAAQVAHGLDVPPQQLLFWQPVHNGKQHMGQFLRLRMAAGLSTGGSVTVAQLKERLLQEASLEVAGYTISSDLFTAIESATLAGLTPPVETQVRILEVVSETDKPLLPVTAKLVETWRKEGTNCSADAALGDPFWMTQELGFAPELIQKTTNCLLAELRACGISSSATLPVPNQRSSAQRLLPATSEGDTEAVVFGCDDEQLAGVLHHAAGDSTLGVVIVVGGPQYRAGSHRQFVYLARYLAEHGIPVLCFDYRGMGDSSGELKGFEHISSDIRCAIDSFQLQKSGITDVVIWGLCDAATAAVFYAASDERVKGLVLVNPWVYSEQGAAKAYLKHYYLQRLLQTEFWRKVFSGKFSPSSSVYSAWRILVGAVSPQPVNDDVAPSYKGENELASEGTSVASSTEGLVVRFTDAFGRFTGKVFFILSGNDLTAAEFMDATSSNRKLRKLMNSGKVSHATLPEADHTFSQEQWFNQVENLTMDMLSRCSPSGYE